MLRQVPDQHLCDDCKIVEVEIAELMKRRKTLKISENDSYSLNFNKEDILDELPGLSASAASGCELCRLLKIAIPNHGLWEVSSYKVIIGPLRLRGTRHGRPHFKELWVDLTYPRNPGRYEETKRSFSLRIETEIGWCGNLLQMPTGSSQNILSATSMYDLKHLIEEILARKPQHQVPELPTRLIDVGGKHGRRQPRLIISADHAPLCASTASDLKQRKYIALSYCWGPVKASHFLKLMTGSLQKMKETIPLRDFPQTLRDAILLTRQLGVRYIWIDSVCIIQDDTLDWEYEAARMATVYENAFLTVCATKGDSCNSGILRLQRLPGAEINVSSHFSEAAKPGSFYLRYRRPPKRQEDVLDFDKTTWSRRAWTFQEGLLSPRPLIFGEDVVHLGFMNLDTLLGHPEKIKSVDFEFSPTHDDWSEVIFNYSRRLLSFPQDRLPAISALAQKFAPLHAAVPRDYLAGIWRYDLVNGLAWQIIGNAPLKTTKPSLEDITMSGSSSTGTNCYVAPSWSWASRSLRVYWGLKGLKPECHIEQAETQLAFPDPFGPVLGGHIVLSGRMCRPPSKFAKDTAFLDFTDPEFDEEALVQSYTWKNGIWLLALGALGSLQADGLTDALRWRVSLILLKTGYVNEYWRIGIVQEDLKHTNLFEASETHTVKII